MNKKGIHPAAHIALDFLLFAALLSGGVLDVARLLITNTTLIVAAGSLEIIAA